MKLRNRKRPRGDVGDRGKTRLSVNRLGLPNRETARVDSGQCGGEVLLVDEDVGARRVLRCLTMRQVVRHGRHCDRTENDDPGSATQDREVGVK